MKFIFKSKIELFLSFNKLCLLYVFIVLCDFCLFSAFAADAAPGQGPDPDSAKNSVFDALSGVLMQLLAVVLVVETALASLFEWRVYRMAFNGRALKAPIMFAIGLLLVGLTGYDPMDRVLGSIADIAPDRGKLSHLLTGLLSAMILAGGSIGLFALLKRLGLRAPEGVADHQEQSGLEASQAWFSIRIIGASPGRAVQVGIEPLEAADETSVPYLIDRVKDTPLTALIYSTGIWERVKVAFYADAQRFPNYGGYKVEADKHYRITLAWLVDNKPQTFGVFRGRFGSRAVVDLTVDVSSVPPLLTAIAAARAGGGAAPEADKAIQAILGGGA